MKLKYVSYRLLFYGDASYTNYGEHSRVSRCVWEALRIAGPVYQYIQWLKRW
jgi:hypothetical protein